MDAGVADPGVEHDPRDGRRRDRAHVAERAQQPGGGAELLGGRLGVKGGLVAGNGDACDQTEDERDDAGRGRLASRRWIVAGPEIGRQPPLGT